MRSSAARWSARRKHGAAHASGHRRAGASLPRDQAAAGALQRRETARPARQLRCRCRQSLFTALAALRGSAAAAVALRRLGADRRGKEAGVVDTARRCWMPRRSRALPCCAGWRSTSCCRCCPALPRASARGGGAALSRPRRRAIGPSRARQGAGLGDGDPRAIRASRALFSPSSRAEVAVMGSLEVQGQAALDLGQDRPAGGDAGRGVDRRLQDQPAGAGLAGRGAAGLCPAARALSRAAASRFIPAARSRPRCCSPRRRG